jgi:uncharacterized protein YbaR (Trm112 family)
MRSELLALLGCPYCNSTNGLQLDATVDDDRAIRKGRLHCQSCKLERPVRDGVTDLLLNLSLRVRAEAKGL